MINFTTKLFDVLDDFMPPQKQGWVRDMRSEAAYIPSGFKRFVFSLGCLRVVLSLVLYEKIGIKRAGQILIGAGVISACLYGILVTRFRFPPEILSPLYILFATYSVAGALALLNLRWMKRYLLLASACLGLLWMLTPIISTSLNLSTNIEFYRALTLEGFVFMACLYIAASFVEWCSEAHHV